VQRHGAGGAFAVDSRALGLASGGRPLPEAVRGKMEAALGADFSNVRVHVGPQAERIGAIAFTVGSDIYFAPGRYQPDTVQGQQLLGHELTHVVQQRHGRVRNPLGSGLAVVQDHALEAEADRLGQRAAMHQSVQRMHIEPRTNRTRALQTKLDAQAPGSVIFARERFGLCIQADQKAIPGKRRLKSRPPLVSNVVTGVIARPLSLQMPKVVQLSKDGIRSLFPATTTTLHKLDYLMVLGWSVSGSPTDYHIRIDYANNDKSPNFHITWENNDFGRRAHFYYNRNGNRSQTPVTSGYTLQNELYKSDVGRKGLHSFDQLGVWSDAIATAFVHGSLKVALEREQKRRDDYYNDVKRQLAIRDGFDTLVINRPQKPRTGWGTPVTYYSKIEVMNYILSQIGNDGWARVLGQETDSNVVIRFEISADAFDVKDVFESDSVLRGGIGLEKSGTPWPFGRNNRDQSDEFNLGDFFS